MLIYVEMYDDAVKFTAFFCQLSNTGFVFKARIFFFEWTLLFLDNVAYGLSL
jgi:hypothetical protein